MKVWKRYYADTFVCSRRIGILPTNIKTVLKTPNSTFLLLPLLLRMLRRAGASRGSSRNGVRVAIDYNDVEVNCSNEEEDENGDDLDEEEQAAMCIKNRARGRIVLTEDMELRQD